MGSLRFLLDRSLRATLKTHALLVLWVHLHSSRLNGLRFSGRPHAAFGRVEMSAGRAAATVG